MRKPHLLIVPGDSEALARPLDGQTLASALAVLESIEATALQHILATCRYRCVGAGEALYHEGTRVSAVLVLLRGSAKLVQRAPGNHEVVAATVRAPAILNDAEVLVGTPTVCGAIAAEEVIIMEISQPAFEEAVDRSPRFSRLLLAGIAQRLADVAARHRSLAFDPLDRRLARALLVHAELPGRGVEGDGKLQVPLTESELARALGVRRSSIARVMGRWARSGLVAASGNGYVVRDLERLQRCLAEPPSTQRAGRRKISSG